MSEHRLKELLYDVLERPLADRDEFLRGACSDERLRERVRALVQAHETADRFLGGPTGGMDLLRMAGVRPPDAKVECADDGMPSRVGRYRIERKIGEGGFGTVYLAHQESPVERRVALKLLRGGLDSREVLFRFDLERQALALMDHPGIATVFDAGTTEDARPFVVMEYVDGLPINAFCDAHRLSLTARLELMERVCLAVQHAHQKGVVHRDIKPSNVIVAMVDARAVPKVIDFGIARAMHGPLAASSGMTLCGQIIGTPQSMPPEQIDGDPDTRADVYGLGVILYELLVGAMPFDADRLAGAPLSELLRIIREEDPPSPVQRFAALDPEASAAAAAARNTDRSRLRRMLSGELSWIVMRAMEKDRSRRYPTAYALSADIRRVLSQEPVEAGPPTNSYRLAKFAQRHRGLISAALISATTLVAGMIFALAMLVEARVQERAAIASEQEAQAVTDFLSSMIASVDPRLRGGDVLLLDVLADSASDFEARFADSPGAAARLDETIGRAYLGLGRLEDAAQHLQRADRVARAQLAENHSVVLPLMRSMAQLYRDRNELDRARQVLDEIDAYLERFPADDPYEPFLTLAARASVERQAGRLDEAAALAERILAARHERFGPRSAESAQIMAFLSGIRLERGEVEEAARIDEEVLVIRRARLGADHPDTLATIRHLAECRIRRGRFDEAIALSREALEGSERRLGENHPETMAARNTLAATLIGQRSFAGAAELFGRNLVAQRAILGAEHRDTMATMNNLAILSGMLGRRDEERTLKRELLALREEVLGPDHPDTMLSALLVALVLVPDGEHAEAEPLLRRAAVYFGREVAGDDPRRLDSQRLLSEVLFATGRESEARAVLLERRLGLRASVERSDAPLRTIRTLAMELLDGAPEDLQDPREASVLLARACALTEGNDLDLLESLARATWRCGDAAAALEHAQAALTKTPDADGDRLGRLRLLIEMCREESPGQ